MKNTIIAIIATVVLASFTYSMEDDDPLVIKTSIHALEHRVGENENIDFLDAEIDMGYDLKKITFKTHLEKAEDEFETAETRLMYRFAIDPYWNFQLGIRKDFQEEGKDYFSVGIDGLYPYYIDTEAVFFVATDGLMQARLALEHEIMITQKVMLMAGVEADVFSNDDDGFVKSEAFIKLMYGITKAFIPYIGIHFEDKYFTKDEESEEVDTVFYTIGLHAWF